MFRCSNIIESHLVLFDFKNFRLLLSIKGVHFETADDDAVLVAIAAIDLNMSWIWSELNMNPKKADTNRRMTTATKSRSVYRNEKKAFSNEMKVDRIVGPSRIAFYCLIFCWQTIAVTTTVSSNSRGVHTIRSQSHIIMIEHCVCIPICTRLTWFFSLVLLLSLARSHRQCVQHVYMASVRLNVCCVFGAPGCRCFCRRRRRCFCCCHQQHISTLCESFWFSWRLRR